MSKKLPVHLTPRYKDSAGNVVLFERKGKVWQVLVNGKTVDTCERARPTMFDAMHYLGMVKA